MVNRFGSWKVNIGANVVVIIAHTVYTISQALFHLAPVVMPIVSVVAMGIFLVGLVICTSCNSSSFRSLCSNYRPASRMWSAAAFSVAPGSIQEKSSNLKFVEKRVKLRWTH